MTKDDVVRILREAMPELQRDYGVTYLGLFGSYVRGEQKKRSDVDLLVEFSNVPGAFGLMDLEDRLRKLVGRKIDLVMNEALKSDEIGERILSEVVRI